MDEMECILEKAGRGVCLGSYDGGICRTGSGLFYSAGGSAACGLDRPTGFA